jgi:hypothetical protein
MDSRYESRTPRELATDLTRAVENTLADIKPTEWDENHISFSIVQTIRDNLAGSSDAPRRDSIARPVFLKAEAYKLSGTIERTHGDIMMVVTDIDRKLSGCGFYEAKAADHYGRYRAFNMRQLRRLTSSTPRLSLLLYEREQKPVSDDDFQFARQCSDSLDKARVRVTGANSASRFRDPTFLSLCPQTFGYHFVSRYLSGRDLDYSRKPLEALRRWLKITKRAAAFIVDVNLSEIAPVPSVPLLPEYSPIPTLSPAMARTSDPPRLL